MKLKEPAIEQTNEIIKSTSKQSNGISLNFGNICTFNI